MLDKIHIGKEYPKKTYIVSREKIKEFALAIGDLNPLYLDEKIALNSKFGKIIAPPTFCVVFAIVPFREACLDPELKINLTKLVHGEQEFEFIDTVKEGDVIYTGGKIIEIQTKRNLDFLTVETLSLRDNLVPIIRGKWTAIISN